MIDRMVDSYCTPEMLCMSLNKDGSQTTDSNNQSHQVSIPNLSKIDWAKFRFQLLSLDSFRWNGRREPSSAMGRIGLESDETRNLAETLRGEHEIFLQRTGKSYALKQLTPSLIS
jgi:hypothetical protein